MCSYDWVPAFTWLMRNATTMQQRALVLLVVNKTTGEATRSAIVRDEVGAVQADCICIVYLSVPVCGIEGGGVSSTLA